MQSTVRLLFINSGSGMSHPGHMCGHAKQKELTHVQASNGGFNLCVTMSNVIRDNNKYCTMPKSGTDGGTVVAIPFL